MRFRSLGQDDCLEKEMATHSSILVWEIPWAREGWLAKDNGVTKSQTQLSNTHTHTHTHTPSSSLKGIYSPNSHTYFPAFIGYLGMCWISIIRKGEEVCYNREETDFGI